jgi:glycosyltransferase involved in cell wall biosynthesis
MCSKNEGLGRVTLEAMSYGKPIIGFDNAGTKEIIEDGKDGVFYNNHEKLSKLMEKFIQEQEWAYKLGLNGIRKIERSFLIEYYAENIYKIIKEL